MRVLIADDQPEVRSSLQLMLEQLPNVTVVGEATGAGDLLAQVSVSCPDLVLLDWELPGLRVTEHLPMLRERCPRSLVMALSSRPEQQEAALATGVDSFVSKGDAPEHLLAAVSDCFHKLHVHGDEGSQET